ncbi:MFS transporter [Rufibacter immobilis]|uniref:MFS transporter n=1 Tax=Rufibacter immobilis TaxID=1348778 RepID=A0A3M9MWM0_9BACT|nr:MFS transporter [Rufibacter immobilis]RNI29952.1 MFS transporter [Rufibacter immobilis]
MKNTSRSPFFQLSLISLLLGGFSIGMTEFLMMGILPDMSQALDISIPKAGHLISIYALGVVIGAPLMVGLTSNLPPKKVLIGLMLMVGVFNGLFGLMSSYPLLMATRLLAGLPHGAFFGIGAVVASKLAQKGKEASAVSVMFAGLTVANIIGVPLGTYIGHHFSWRYSFALIAVVALGAALSVKLWMPSVKSESETSFRQSLNIFKHKELWLIIGLSAIGTGGMFAWISYIAPLMTEVAGFNPGSMTVIMVVAGLGMAVGNFMGGRLADKFSPLTTTTLLFLSMVVVLLLTTMLVQFKPTAIMMTFLTGAIGFSVIAPMQMLMVQQAKGAEMLASSLLQATSNMGNALGAFLGGLPIAAGFGFTSPEYVGAGLAFMGVLFCLLLIAAHKQKARNLAAV